MAEIENSSETGAVPQETTMINTNRAKRQVTRTPEDYYGYVLFDEDGQTTIIRQPKFDYPNPPVSMKTNLHHGGTVYKVEVLYIGNQKDALTFEKEYLQSGRAAAIMKERQRRNDGDTGGFTDIFPSENDYMGEIIPDSSEDEETMVAPTPPVAKKRKTDNQKKPVNINFLSSFPAGDEDGEGNPPPPRDYLDFVAPDNLESVKEKVSDFLKNGRVEVVAETRTVRQCCEHCFLLPALMEEMSTLKKGQEKQIALLEGIARRLEQTTPSKAVDLNFINDILDSHSTTPPPSFVVSTPTPITLRLPSETVTVNTPHNDSDLLVTPPSTDFTSQTLFTAPTTSQTTLPTFTALLAEATMTQQTTLTSQPVMTDQTDQTPSTLFPLTNPTPNTIVASPSMSHRTIPTPNTYPTSVRVGSRKFLIDIGCHKSSLTFTDDACKIPASTISKVLEVSDNLKNFSTTLVLSIYEADELIGRAVDGSRDGKLPLSPRRKAAVKTVSLDAFTVPSCQREDRWGRECREAVNKRLRSLFNFTKQLEE